MSEAEQRMKAPASPGNATLRRRRDGKPLTYAGAARLAGKAREQAAAAASAMGSAIALAPSPTGASYAAALGLLALAEAPAFASVRDALRLASRTLLDEVFPGQAEARKLAEAQNLPHELARMRAATGPHPDAELIALCVRHPALLAAVNASEEDYDEADPVTRAYYESRDAIAEARPTTLAGLLAIAHVAKAEAVTPSGGENPENCFAANFAWQIVGDLLRLYGGALKIEPGNDGVTALRI